MKYEIYIGQKRHYCVVRKDTDPEKALCFIANKWKVAKKNLRLETGWIDKKDTLYFEETEGTKEVWVITRISSLPKSYLK